MKRWIDLLRKNPGLSLLSANVTLLVLYVLIALNPFGLGSYAKARRLISFGKNDIRSITLAFADGSSIALDRTDEAWPARKEGMAEPSAAAKAKPETEYRWKLQVNAAGKSPASFAADRERIRDLLGTLDGLRRYYDLPSSDENRKKFEINDRSTALVLRDGSGKEEKVRVGLTGSRSDSSYVFVEGDSSIYQVESDLKPRLGAGDPLFFRDRSVLPADLNSDSVSSISYITPRRTVRIAKTGTEWQMIEPVPGKLREDVFRPLLEDVMAWKARSFPEKLPAGLKAEQGRIEITYNRGTTEPGIVQIDIEGTKDYGGYFVRIDKNLYEVSSYYLEDFKDPEKMLDRPSRGR